MGTVVKVIAIVLAVVIGVGVLATVIGVGVNLGRYMFNQGFDFQQALAWSWNEYTEFIQKHLPFRATTAEEFPMTNVHVEIKGPVFL